MDAYLPNVLPIFGRHQISSGSLLVLLASFLPHCPFFFAYPKMCPPNGFQFVVVFVVVGVGKVFFLPPQFCDVAKVVIITHKAI
jgi:hypothetical protein